MCKHTRARARAHTHEHTFYLQKHTHARRHVHTFIVLLKPLNTNAFQITSAISIIYKKLCITLFVTDDLSTWSIYNYDHVSLAINCSRFQYRFDHCQINAETKNSSFTCSLLKYHNKTVISSLLLCSQVFHESTTSLNRCNVINKR